MFGRKTKTILSTQDGDCIMLDQVPDPVFAEKMLGDGVAVIPTDNVVKSPVDGVVVQVFDTLHAYSIQSSDGLDILVHIGLNTVELKGEGFSPKVKSGDKVKAGDVLCETDINFLREKGYEIYTPIVITNISDIKSFKPIPGNVRAGETAVIEYSIK
ncbi:MAG: PTS glucose transporter subunit IIA [Clostridiales bacterium]|nr:PTS glucose transporter subunit IIA [Clostridiales bacterium]